MRTGAAGSGNLLGRLLALLLVALAVWLMASPLRELGRREDRPIWFEPGRYQGPPVRDLDSARIEEIGQRAMRLDF